MIVVFNKKLVFQYFQVPETEVEKELMNLLSNHQYGFEYAHGRMWFIYFDLKMPRQKATSTEYSSPMTSVLKVLSGMELR